VDEKDRIVGLGEKLPSGLPKELESLKTPEPLAWVGFVSTALQSDSVSAFLVDQRNRFLTPIGEPIQAATAVGIVPAADEGEPVPNLSWQGDKNWTPNGIPPIPQLGKPEGMVRGSWSGSDLNVGSLISSPIEAPSNHCLIIPVFHGPSTGGQSVEVVDAKTNTPLAAVPIQSRDKIWRLWGLSIKPTAERIRIIARDDGSGWGEWLAIGEPHYCREKAF
jgi:hypothetical protein